MDEVEDPPHGIPKILIDLAARREPDALSVVDDATIAVAADHRMTGLLWTWAADELDDGSDGRTGLAMQDLRVRAHHAKVWRALQYCVAQLASIGIDVATVKGVTAEARWYGRPGERLCSDVDLLISPHQTERMGEILETLSPGHPWASEIDALVASGRIQSIAVWVDGIEIDLHPDLLKLGLPTRGATEHWRRTRPYALPGGGTVLVLDDTLALFHFLVHLNKDRFQRLLQFADVVHVIDAGHIDWDDLIDLARREGIDVSVRCALQVVLKTMGRPWPDQLERPRGPRATLWRVIWRPSVRLLGTEGRLRFKRRQHWTSFMARGRSAEFLRWWVRDLWPPAVAVNTQYPDIVGPYLWKLGRGRVQGMVDRRRSLDNLRHRPTP